MSSNVPANRHKILITDSEFSATVADIASDFQTLELVCNSDEQHMIQLAVDSDTVGLITQMEEVGPELLEQLPALQVILKMGRSYFNVDVAAVRERELTFGSVPRKGPNCVAELALTFIMSLSKDLLISHDSVVSGAYRYRGLRPEISAQWKMAYHWMHNTGIHEVMGKTLGIVGMGEIGCELARRTSVLGMRNIYYKRTPLSAELEHRFDATYCDLETLLRESDYICIAMPHTTETECMIGSEELAFMKESAFLVNIARGGIIDEEALIDALRAKRIAGAGLDVFTYEPLPEDSPLCQLDNVILTPHIGGGTSSNRTLELSAALQEMEHVLSGGKPHVDLSSPLPF